MRQNSDAGGFARRAVAFRRNDLRISSTRYSSSRTILAALIVAAAMACNVGSMPAQLIRVGAPGVALAAGGAVFCGAGAGAGLASFCGGAGAAGVAGAA